MKRWIVPLFAALLALGTSHVASAQGQSQNKGKGQGQAQTQSQAQAEAEDYYQDKGKDMDKGKDYDHGKDYDKSNHGQVVSECNHRANERNLKGHERKDFTEWCESRGARYKYDNDRYGKERDCYRKANKKDLSGDKRAKFLDKCFAETDAKYYGGKVPVQKKD
jgi:hypothetical protein